ncbi:PTS sugar transporter subunit IIA [Xylocopilactobacillus apicola]|uniref:PTS sugar transporter subunit IIA n=1 Tax=Xylocopilactobacillus apicola TaxID=2932184 RepID=A0AAU9D236_9LACO|nr:PTS sugar transporter subunit IIA [Xylocopilactobacillus apicola]BDR57598.1 PTS sugar transporter subunit IIA [Xylocopilactobacillus apicola]
MSEQVNFDKDFVKHFPTEISFSEIVDEMSTNLIAKDLVTPTYPQAVKERELVFPTGLPTEPIGVAIPHTDPNYVKQNAISVGILHEPITMTVMGTEDELVDVKIIFLLSLAQSNKQLNILQKIMSIVQDQNLLEEFLTKSDEFIVKEVKKSILEESS